MAKLSLDNSVKFKRLLHTTKLPRPYAKGLLDALWTAAHSNGNPVIGNADAIEIASEWPGSKGEWFTNLKIGCWIVQEARGTWKIKNYFEHCPDYVIKRIARERGCEYKGLRQILVAEDKAKTESGGIRRNFSEENGSLPRPDQSNPIQTNPDQTKPDKPSRETPRVDSAPDCDSPIAGEADFLKVLAEYPQGERADKTPALRVWRSMFLKVAEVERIVEGVRLWKNGKNWQEDAGKYVPKLSKFLADRQWENPPAMAPPAEKFNGINKGVELVKAMQQANGGAA